MKKVKRIKIELENGEVLDFELNTDFKIEQFKGVKRDFENKMISSGKEVLNIICGPVEVINNIPGLNQSLVSELIDN